VYYIDMTTNLVQSDVRVVLCITVDMTFNRVHMLGEPSVLSSMTSNQVLSDVRGA
jgi:hypothetical protein